VPTRRRAPESVASRIAIGMLLSSVLILALPVAASAHAPTISATCSTLDISLQDYPSSAEAPTPNSATVSIDGTEVATVPFGQSYVATFDLGDPLVAHAWSVAIHAVDASFDPTFTGRSEPCEAPTPQDATAAVEVSPSTCTTGQTVALGAIAYAVWGPLEVTGSSYSVVATAVDGHLFDDGLDTRILTGTLYGPLAPSTPQCAPPPVVETTELGDLDCSTTTLTTIITTTTTGWLFDASSAAWVPAMPTSLSTSAYRPATPQECPPEIDPDDPPVVETPEVGSESFGPEVAVAAPRRLAHNGVDPALAMLAAAALLAGGYGLRRLGRRDSGNPADAA